MFSGDDSKMSSMRHSLSAFGRGDRLIGPIVSVASSRGVGANHTVQSKPVAPGVSARSVCSAPRVTPITVTQFVSVVGKVRVQLGCPSRCPPPPESLR